MSIYHSPRTNLPSDYVWHIQAARDKKQNKVEYLQLLAEFNRLNISNYYVTNDNVSARTLLAFHSEGYVEFDNVCRSGSLAIKVSHQGTSKC